eukprot:936962-Rhodomonas_salina.1
MTGLSQRERSAPQPASESERRTAPARPAGTRTGNGAQRGDRWSESELWTASRTTSFLRRDPPQSGHKSDGCASDAFLALEPALDATEPFPS